jgi:hypothetical protein
MPLAACACYVRTNRNGGHSDGRSDRTVINDGAAVGASENGGSVQMTQKVL